MMSARKGYLASVATTTILLSFCCGSVMAFSFSNDQSDSQRVANRSIFNSGIADADDDEDEYDVKDGFSELHRAITTKRVFYDKQCGNIEESAGQFVRPSISQSNPQQAYANYQTWVQNADLQLRLHTVGLPADAQLQQSINAIESELSQWGGFLRQYYPLIYTNRCAQLQQRRQALAKMTNPMDDVVPCNPQQTFERYILWLQNVDMQLRQQTAGMSPVMQLQLSIKAIERELSQWGGFLQQYYPLVYVNRYGELQQRRQLQMQMVNGGGLPMPSPVSFYDVSSGSGSAYRCAACNGTGNCRLCKGSGMYITPCYTGLDKSDHSTCPQCRGSGRCQSCNRYEIRRLD